MRYEQLAVDIWQLCIDTTILVTAAHNAGVDNVIADKESRHFHISNTEWQLNPHILHDALELIKFHPHIDLFASRLNDQFELYCSYRPDPGAGFVDAFSIFWSEFRFYCFPPFSCILKVLQKIRQDRATGVIVVPKWPT